VSRPAFTLLPGSSEPGPASPYRLLDYWSRAEDKALEEASAAPLGQLIPALDRVATIRAQRQAAERRVRRVELEREGRRWLWVAGGGQP
jgi:hypothetical protein